MTRISIRRRAASLALGVLGMALIGHVAPAGAAGPPAPPANPAPAAVEGASPRFSHAEQLMVGTWFGDAVLPGKPETLQQFLATRRADGTYTLEVRNYQEGRMRQRIVNSGVWGISNGIYVTLTTDVEGQKTVLSDPSYTQVYVLRGLSANEFRYTHVGSGREFRVVRSTADFRLPD